MSQLQTLLNQFHSRYPVGSVISELAATHEQNYVIRALVQVGGMTLSTGMAAAPDVEQAEDRAKVRALEALSLGSQMTPEVAPIATLAKPVIAEASANAPDPVRVDLPIAPTEPLVSPKLDTQPRRSAAIPELPSLEMDFSRSANPNSIDTLPLTAIEEDPFPEGTASRSIANPTSKAEPRRKSESKSKVASVDDESIVQEARLQTDVELRRVGWTPDEGRKHLMETYGKRSRLHLTDEELLDFLHYLKSLPSAMDSPF